MTPEEYCRDKAAPAGSNLYYCTLFHSSESKRKLHALFAFYRELGAVLYQSSDPGAAKMSLYWWHEEIGRLFSGAARHPVTRELDRLQTRDYLTRRELSDCIAGMVGFLEDPASENYSTWLQRHIATSGYIWKTAGLACDCAHQDSLAALVDSGCCYGAFELLHHIRHFAGLGLSVLPAELLNRHGVGIDTIAGSEASGAQSGFFIELYRRLYGNLQTCLADLRERETDKTLFAVIMLKILSALCLEYQSARQQITQARISLTPIRKLWIAWRAS